MVYNHNESKLNKNKSEGNKVGIQEGIVGTKKGSS